MPIIWVAVGGRKDLTATLIGTFFVLWLFQTLIVISQQYALIVIGALLLVTILFMPGGYIVWAVENRDAIFNWRRHRAERMAESRAVASDGASE
jgi:branched-chain amino acid transport system permease protein